MTIVGDSDWEKRTLRSADKLLAKVRKRTGAQGEVAPLTVTQYAAALKSTDFLATLGGIKAEGQGA